jgi:hypothetical protein
LENILNQEKTNPKLEREAFVLRLWRETPGSQEWRGQLQHVRTGEVASFQDMEEIFEYIRRKLETQVSFEEVTSRTGNGLR